MSANVGHSFESILGDRVTVRYKTHRGTWAHVSYIGPRDKWGIFPEDTSGRTSYPDWTFDVLFPRHADDCEGCATIMRWRARKDARH